MPAPAGSQARARRAVVRLVFVVYLLAIFEGILRKWALPELSQWLFFIRDPFVVAAYVIATLGNLWPKRSVLFWCSIGFGLLGLVVAFIQGAMGGFGSNQMLLAAYGWRNYFLYIPLGFLIGQVFDGTDLGRLFRVTLYIAIPIVFLVFIQFWAPLNSPINVGLAADRELQFRGLGLGDGHTRPMGTFTSTTGQMAFVSSAFAMVLSLVILPRAARPVNRLVLVAGALAVVICAGLGGSRGALVHCGLAVVAAALLGLTAGGARLRLRALILPLALAAAAVVAFPVAFPEEFGALVDRFTGAEQYEADSGGLLGRALAGFVDFTGLLDSTPPLGVGLGYGGNAGASIRESSFGGPKGALAEADWSRHIVDLGPAVGIVFIVYRIILTGWLALAVLRSIRRRPDPVPIVLFSFVGPELLYGQATGHGTMNVYIWLFMGFCLAATRFPLRPARMTLRRRPVARHPGTLAAGAPTSRGASGHVRT